MTRRHRDQTFRKLDLVRAYRAAQSAGIPNPRIEIDRHGTISIVPGEARAEQPAEGNELDNWMAKHNADQT